MKLMMFEYGDIESDSKSRVIEFKGNLFEYDKKQKEIFKNNTDKLELIRSGYEEGNNCLFYVYYSKLMKKRISLYVIPLEK